MLATFLVVKGWPCRARTVWGCNGAPLSASSLFSLSPPEPGWTNCASRSIFRSGCARCGSIGSIRCFGSTPLAGQSKRRGNLVTLSALFWEELRAHPIPVDSGVVRALANNSGCLDLYTWLTWRCYQAKGEEQLAFIQRFRPGCPTRRSGVYPPTEVPERITGWLKLVRIYWPECPVAVSTDGRYLELAQRSAIVRAMGERKCASS
jgi:hypothetical protein